MMSAQVSSNKAIKLLGIVGEQPINTNTQRNDINGIGSMYCKKQLIWLSDEIIENKENDIDINLKNDEKFTINIRNNCNYNLFISTLSDLDSIDEHNIIERKILKPNSIFSLCLKGGNDKYSPILINHKNNIFYQKLAYSKAMKTGNDKYMIYIPNKSPSLKTKHYITIYSSNIYTIHDKLKSNTNTSMLDTLTVYMNIIYIHVLLMCLLIFTLFIGYKSLFISATIGSIFGTGLKRTDKTKIIAKFQKYMSFTILICCIISYFYDHVLLDMSCDKLMGLTNLQFLVFCLVLFEYAFEIAIFRLSVNDLIHHTLGWIGIVLFSSQNMAGGVITLWLFDILTAAIYYFGIKFTKILYWIIFILIRIIWYNYISYQCIGCVPDNDMRSKFAFIFWWLFANIYHVYMMWDNWLSISLSLEWHRLRFKKRIF